MAPGGSQSEYNKKVRSADLFILLAYTKVGMYTAQEFKHAFGQFKATQKPFIFTYFKTPDAAKTEESLGKFQLKLKDLGYYYCPFTDADDLWNQFNKELERLEGDGFGEFKHAGSATPGRIIQQGDKSIYIERGDRDININIQ